MMAGIPIIASDIPMNLEAITDQVDGLTFPLGNSAELQTKMQWMIECPDEAKALGVAARKTATQRFDIEKIAREYEAVLRFIVKRKIS
jgi:glycosyltransferase involved in cell wall biosynthesis